MANNARRRDVDLGKLHTGRKYNRETLRQKVPWYQNSYEHADAAPIFELPPEPVAADPPFAIPKELRPLGYKPRYLRTIRLIDEPLPSTTTAVVVTEEGDEEAAQPRSVHSVPFEKTLRTHTPVHKLKKGKHAKPRRLQHSASCQDLPTNQGSSLPPSKLKALSVNHDDEQDDEQGDEQQDDEDFSSVSSQRSHTLHSIKTMGKLSPLHHHSDPARRHRPQRDHSRRVSVEEAQDLRNSEWYFGSTAKPQFFAQYRNLYSRPYLFVEDPARAGPRMSRDSDGYLSIPSSTDSSFIPAYPSSSYLKGIDKALSAVGSGVALPDSHGLPTEDKLSPRSQLLTAGVTRPTLAVPFLLRNAMTKVYDFSFQSLGDTVIIEFAKCLANELPYVEEINVRDNRLSDAGLHALLAAIASGHSTMLRLRRLDISENTVGAASAQTLRAFLVSQHCPLQALLVDHADIDDRECALFMTACEKNLSLKELFMSRNGIGQSEHLNVVQPSFVTGGEAIANMLACNLVLVHLDLSWNALRLESSIALARSVGENRTLVALHLAYNACGDAGAMAFGEALTVNQCLQVLDLSYNRIGCKGAQVLARSLRSNRTLRALKMDGNSLGREGGQALLVAVCENHSEQGCDVSLHACHLSQLVGHSSGGPRGAVAPPTASTEYNVAAWPAYGGPDSSVFSAKEPTGRYTLDLVEPYDRMMADELLRLATTRKGCRFLRVDHRTAAGAPKRAVALVRKERKASSASSSSSSSVVNGEDALETLGLDALFAGVDWTDRHAVLRVLNRLGLFPKVEHVESLLSRLTPPPPLSAEGEDVEEGEAEEDKGSGSVAGVLFHAVFQLLDSDGSGKIDADEVEEAFRMLGEAEFDDREIADAIATYDLSGDGEMEASEFVAFVQDKLLTRLKRALLPAYENNSSSDGSSGRSALWELLDGATQRPWRVPDGGVLEVDFVYEREAFASHEEAHRVARLPASAIDQLVRNVTALAASKGEQDELLNVAVRDSELLFTASQAYEVLEACGLLAGSNCERKLAAIARMLPQLLTPREAQVLVARTVTLRERCRLKAVLGSAYSVVLGNPTAHYALDLAKDCDRGALAKLAEVAQGEKLFSRHRAGRKDTSQHGNWENFRNEELDGAAVALSAAWFHVLPRRGKLRFDYVSTTRPRKGTVAMSDRRFTQLLHELETSSSSSGSDVLLEEEEEEEQEELEDAVGVGLLRRFSPPPLARALSRRTKQTEFWDKTRSAVLKKAAWQFGGKASTATATAATASTAKETIALQLVQLEAAVCDRWLSCAQASRLVACLPPQCHARAEAARLLFARVIDLDQFHTVFDSLLSRHEQYVCAKALGWLNLVNPMAPERAYELDLSIRDERAMAQLLVQLAIAEPGENWINQRFSLLRGDPGIPGWKLPVRWEKEEDEGGGDGEAKEEAGAMMDAGGVDRSGYLEMEYYSGGDRGCAPVPAFRKTLMNRVLAGTRLYC